MARNRIVTEIRADSAQMRTEFSRAQKKVRDFGGGLDDSKKKLLGFAAGFVGVRAGINLFGQLVDASSDLNESLSKTQAVFGSDNTIAEWAKGQEQALGLSQQDVLDYASRFGGALKEIGGKSKEEAGRVSQDLVGLTSDLASFFNSSQSDARDAIAGALTGEFEMLKKYNVVINETILKEQALTMGLSDGKSALDARTKQTAALALIYQKTSDAQGDFAKTSDGVANQERILEAQIKNTKAALGQELLPVQLEFIKIARGGIEVLGEFTPALKAFADGALSLTRFLVDHKAALTTVVGGYVAYRAVVKSVQWGALIGSWIKSTAAITAETAALSKNTAAQAANSRARAAGGGGGGRAGAAAVTAFLGYQVGSAIGESFAEDSFNGKPTVNDPSEGYQDELNAQREKFDLEKKMAEQAAVDIENQKFRNRLIQERADIEAAAAAAREKSNAKLQTELNTLAEGVLKTEFGYKTANQQLDAQQEKLSKLTEQARAYSEASGLSPSQNLDSGATIELAREAASQGRLAVAKQLLQLAQEMQTKKADILTLEENIRSENEAQREAIAAKNNQDQALAKSQKDSLAAQAQEVTILKLKAAGRTEEAAALEKEIALRREAKQIAAATGLDEANALKLARQKNDLKMKAQDGGAGDNLDNRFDEDGNRKLARDGQRKRIVLIRRDRDGNRIDGDANNKLRQAAQRLGQKNNPILPKTDRLIELAERQLTAFERLQTSS